MLFVIFLEPTGSFIRIKFLFLLYLLISFWVKCIAQVVLITAGKNRCDP